MNGQEVKIIDQHILAAQEGLNLVPVLIGPSGVMDERSAPLVTAIASLATAHATIALALIKADR